MLLLGLLAFVIGLCSDSVWAMLASRLRSWFNASPRRGEAMGAVGGVSMIGLGVGHRADGPAGVAPTVTCRQPRKLLLSQASRR